jgi:hypothetical protein
VWCIAEVKNEHEGFCRRAFAHPTAKPHHIGSRGSERQEDQRDQKRYGADAAICRSRFWWGEDTLAWSILRI